MMSKKSPQLRFEGFTDDWEQRKLGELSQKISVGIATSSSKYFSSQDHGVPFIKNQDIKENRINTKNLEYISKEFDNKNKNKRVKQGDIITARTGYPGLSAVVPKELEGAQTFTTLITRPISEMILSEYISIFINSPYGMKQISGMEAGGAQKNVNAGIVQNLLIPLPSLDEQKKISNFILKLDDTIALHQRKLDLLKEQKKGYLQKMFPKNGAKVPELRFAGFADDWEERKLSSGLREYTDRVIVEDDKEYYQISVRNNFGGITLRGSKIGNKIGRKRQAKINLTKYPQTLIFTRQTVEQGGIGWVDKYCDGAIVTENMPTISLDTSVFSKYFLTNLFQTRIFYKNAILDNIEGGSAQIAIHESKFLSSILLFPNLDEQEKIGQFFKQLDNTIALHQRKIDLLKEQKKGFLQKMFV
ncbi:restriction endonuclease subunit S [Streptococcus thermophilus]|uniref:restriction endonuclease subunit S n=3 Tax=Streptococcus thermophilus TaxID=1308 RepID=UPI0024057CFF|nr:restriction endonuclease subunit S [Streptococcus thermophilus]MDG0264824.1 restriction endonuclease subunit S [Streptococcus thermophilus]